MYHIEPYKIKATDSYKQYILSKKGNTFIALKDDELIASITVEGKIIENIVVKQSMQGKEYGREATKFAMNKVLEAGHKSIYLVYLDQNKKAEKLYKSLGFEYYAKRVTYRKLLR